MKRGSLIAALVASFAANLGLLGWHLLRPPVPAVPTAGASSPVLAASAPAGLLPALGREFLALTPAQLRDRLKDSGLPETLVQQLIAARIQEPVRRRRNELIAAARAAAPLWRLAAMKSNRLALLTPEQRGELRDLETAARDETLRLLGPAHVDRDGLIAFTYGYVSPEKAVLLDALVRDYDNLAAHAREESRYLKTGSDREREAFLRAEKERDLATLLTPEEREAYELRSSATAGNPGLQARMAAFQPTEAEYRALFALQKAAEERLAAGIQPPAPTLRPPGTPADMSATMVTVDGGAQTGIGDDDARAVLGEARFAEWQASNAPYYQSLARLVRTNSLPPETLRSVGGLLAEASDASWRIAADETLSAPQKKTALAALATQARMQVGSQLGPDLAPNYLRSVGWLDRMSEGMGVRIHGSTTYYRQADPPPPSGGAPGP